MQLAGDRSGTGIERKGQPWWQNTPGTGDYPGTGCVKSWARTTPALARPRDRNSCASFERGQGSIGVAGNRASSSMATSAAIECDWKGKEGNYSSLLGRWWDKEQPPEAAKEKFRLDCDGLDPPLSGWHRSPTGLSLSPPVSPAWVSLTLGCCDRFSSPLPAHTQVGTPPAVESHRVCGQLSGGGLS